MGIIDKATGLPFVSHNSINDRDHVPLTPDLSCDLFFTEFQMTKNIFIPLRIRKNGHDFIQRKIRLKEACGVE